MIAEIITRFDIDGNPLASSARDHGGHPVPLTEQAILDSLPTIVAGIDATLALRIAELEAELAELKNEPATNTPTDPLSIWWETLTVVDKLTIYEHASNAILAWDRAKASGKPEDMQVVYGLIQANAKPELAALKADLFAQLPQD